MLETVSNLPMTESPSPLITSEPLAISPRQWKLSAAIIMFVGTLLRLYYLTLVPLHHDEGNNGKFVLRLVNENFYRYDPQNYHGPSLYYFASIIPWLSRIFGKSFQENYGLSTFTIRLVPAVFGIATIWLVLTLKRHLGGVGSLAGAALLAISPGAVYLSRYFIHEDLLVFFAVAVVVASLRFYETARVIYLMLASSALALLFATKETAIITAVVLLLAVTSTIIYFRIRKGLAPKSETEDQATEAEQITFIERLGGLTQLFIYLFAALSLFLSIDILLYSSFFTNYPQGVYDSLRTFQFWASTSKSAHIYRWYKYLIWSAQEELPLLVLSLIGFAIALWRATNRFAVFAGLWAFGTFAAYSLIPYKTPWLMLNFVVPMTVIGGYACEEIYRIAWKTNKRPHVLAIGLLVTLSCSYQTVMLNFFHYDDPSYAYVYVHTTRELFALLAEIDRIAERAGTGTDTRIEIASPDYWPLPWYLRHYSTVDYRAGVMDFDQPIVIAESGQELALMVATSNRYRLVGSNLRASGTYVLRPQIELLLFVRRDLADQ